MPVEESIAVDAVIQKLIDKGVVRQTTHCSGEFISNVFLRPKPSGEFRLILDLTRLNKHVEYQHFKMFSLKTACDLVLPLAFMASIDLRDAYYTVPVDENFCKFLRFEWNNQLFEFVCMPNGLAPAPRIFTRLLKPVFAKLGERGHVMFPYIDDIFVIAETKQACQEGVTEFCQLAQDLGFIIHKEKSVLTPTQRLKFLGFFIDSLKMQIQITPEKVAKFHNFVKELGHKGKKLKIRRIAVLVGLMTAYSVAVLYGQAHIKNLEIAKNEALKRSKGNFERWMVIPDKAWEDIQWWMLHIASSPMPIVIGRADIQITTDASLSGWGAHTDDQATGGRWLPQEANSHINVLELQAVLLGLQSLITQSGVHVHVKTDNLTTLAYIRNMGGSKSPPCNDMAKNIWNWAEQKRVWLTVGYIPGKENVLADAFSRRFADHLEWQLNDQIFEQICDRWGTPDVDLFASRRNFKLKKYVAWHPEPEAWRVDAFTFEWKELFLYVFPPFCLIARVARKLQHDRSHAILVTPTWTTQPWFAAVQKWSKQMVHIPRGPKNLLPQGPLLERGDVSSTPLTVFLF